MLHTLRSRKAHLVQLHRQLFSVPKVKNFINGVFEESQTKNWIEVINPASQEVVALLPQTTKEELERAEKGAAEAFKTWKEVPVQQRQRIFFNFQALIREHTDELAHSITTEQGKTLADAKGDIFRGLEVVETACMLGPSLLGETAENLARGLDTYSYKQPLGKYSVFCAYKSLVNK